MSLSTADVAAPMSLVLDGGELMYRLVVPGDLRAALTEALVEDLAASTFDWDDSARRASARALLDGLLAGLAVVEFPADAAVWVQASAAYRAREAISDGRRADALAWVALWAQFPERDDLA